MAAHRIRLGARWQLTFRSSNGSGSSEPIFVDLPIRRGDSVLENSTGTIELRRNFNCPANLAHHQTVRLVVAGISSQARVRFNGEQLERPAAGTGNSAPAFFEISRLLRDYNEILIVAPLGGEASDPNEPLVETVTLEIDPA